MIETVRASLRVKTETFDDEIGALIEACKLDLDTAGVPLINETNPLCVRAIILYCKANFGFSDEQEKYLEMYDRLKITMSNSSGYDADEDN